MITAYAASSVACGACGGTMERIHHPMQIPTPDSETVVDRVRRYGTQPPFNETWIKAAVVDMMDGIRDRLAAEIEMDRIESLWYNEEKEGGHNGKEADNGDHV